MDADGGCDEDVAVRQATEAEGHAAGAYLAHPTADRAAAPGFGDFRGYFAQRKRKLALQAEQLSADGSSMMFSGVVFHINGYTQPSHYELKRLLVERGARFLHYLAKSEVTHIVASRLTLAKEKALRAYRVVRPEWVVDSVRAGRRLAWQAYALGAARMPPEEPVRMAPEVPLSLTPEVPPRMPPPPPANPAAAPVVDRFDEGLNRPWVRRNLATAPGFVERYYASSRLHHLATWKAEMQDLVGRLRSQQQQQQHRRPPAPADAGSRVVMHVDFDCFFVSVSLLGRPELQDAPAAVCHAQEAAADGSTSQIASCNYAARSFGVRNGMLLGQALAKCPRLATVAYDFAAYRRVAQAFFRVAVEMSDETQVLSVDEALLDVSRRAPHAEAAARLAEDIRARVFAATGCRVSVGMGPSACVARQATRRAKPDGAVWLALEDYLELPLRVTDLPGVGDVLGGQLAAAGLPHLADVRRNGLHHAQAAVGAANGLMVYEGAWGRDTGPVTSDTRRQAFGCEIGWAVRLSTAAEADGFVRQLAEHAYAAMRQAKRWARAVTVRVKVRREGAGKPSKFLGHGVCDAVARTLELRDRGVEHVMGVCCEALRALGVDPLDIRAVGVRLHRLEDDVEEGRGVADMLAAAAPASAACAMPSASQVDPEVLAALPADVRREIEQHYAGGSTSSNTGVSSAARPVARGSRRGRPRKLQLSTRQQQQQQQKQRRLTDVFRRVAQLDTVVPSQADATVWAGLPASVRREIAREYVRERQPTLQPPLPEKPAAAEDLAESEPSLCGASRVEDVCRLVAQWVEMADGCALAEDEDALAEYLEELVSRRNVVRAAEVLRYLRFCVGRWKPECSEWRRTLASVLARVNRVCVDMYDACLDL
ncbi:deoxycytidyl transferase [Coemansia interrupta]|uniref:DNA repair protein REV1 n=1 Tax=Coemansia interrupta TaxID=1126814 RepID=A0A9W8LIT8_9FUNG|nr:deoxycytidyl transferase [Coemansia interrupta]